jgi:hypothetical protein
VANYNIDIPGRSCKAAVEKADADEVADKAVVDTVEEGTVEEDRFGKVEVDAGSLDQVGRSSSALT